MEQVMNIWSIISITINVIVTFDFSFKVCLINRIMNKYKTRNEGKMEYHMDIKNQNPNMNGFWFRWLKWFSYSHF